MRFRGSPRLTIFLFLLVGLVFFQLYRTWKEGLPELPGPVQESSQVRLPKERKPSLRSLRRNTANIVKNNLFDPDRGAAGNKAVETPLQTKTTPEEFILLGTLITSRDRKALIQVLPTSARATVRGRKATSSAKSPQAGEVRRIALGDPLGDYLLTEIEPHKVILKKGSEQLELVLDFVGRLQKLEKPQVPKIKRPEPKKTASQTRRKTSRSKRRRDRDR